MPQITLEIKGYTEVILIFIISLAYFNLVFGLPWLQYHDPEICWTRSVLKFNNSKFQIPKHSNLFPVCADAVSIDQINKRRIASLSNHSPKILVSIEDCEIDYFENLSHKNGHEILRVSIEDIKEALREKPPIDPAVKLPEIYHEFLPVFSKEEADKLPPHRPSDRYIILKPESEAPWGPLVKNQIKQSREAAEVQRYCLAEGQINY